MPEDASTPLQQHKEALLACVAAFERHAQDLEKAEAALREREATITALFANASQGIITVNQAGRIVQGNAMAGRLFGYEELAGMQIEDLLPEELGTRHKEYREAYFQSPRARPMGLGIELSGRRRDGSTFPVEISLSHVRTKEGVLAVAFVSDITERKRAEATLRALLESASQGIIGIDAGGTIVMVNAMAERLFGYTRQEMVGGSIEMLLPERVRGRHIEHRRGYFGEPRTRPMGIGVDLSARRKDGSEFPVEISLSHVNTDRGVLAVAFVTDITERKRAEEALVHHAQDLARSNADLQQFAYVASHDLQEPIRTVTSFAELLARRYRDNLGQNGESLIDHILSAANRMEVLVHDLLAYTRVVNDVEPRRTTIDARTAVEWAINNLHQAIKESGAEITVGALPTVNSEFSALVQVFQNLISNAIKYRQPGHVPVIDIQASVTGSECVFAVQDRGVGIPAAYHETVFGLFQRLDRSVAGTGLGLAICRRIIEKYGGRMWVESEPGEGSTFKFILQAAAHEHRVPAR